MILDVGCGIAPRGDVNVDLPQGGNRARDRTRANVYASVYQLPFRDNSFSTAYFNGLLHHLQDPIRGWHEICRVTSDMICGREPGPFPNPLAYLFPFRFDKTEKVHYFRSRQLRRIVGSSRKFDSMMDPGFAFAPYFSWIIPTLRIIALRNEK